MALGRSYSSNSGRADSAGRGYMIVYADLCQRQRWVSCSLSYLGRETLRQRILEACGSRRGWHSSWKSDYWQSC